MSKRTSICLNTLLNQKPQQNQKKDIKKDNQNIKPELTCDNQLQQIKRRNFQKLLTSVFTNSLGKIEFTREDQGTKNTQEKTNSLKDVVRKIHEKFIETTPNLIIRNKQEVPDFIRQRDLQKKEMMKIIQQNQDSQDNQENKNSYQIFVIEFVLIISIILMWKKIIENFQLL